MRSFRQDYVFGKGKEDELLPTISAFFKDTIQKATSRFSKYDFIGQNGTTYELKSRTCDVSKFPTTLFPKSKVGTNDNQIFLFNFTNGLYYIKYDPDIFDTIKTTLFKRQARVDFNDKPQYYYEIPVELLKKVEITQIWF